MLCPNCSGYSVLTHEAILDAAWKDSIVPMLLKRFLNATPELLLQAHPCAYRNDYPGYGVLMADPHVGSGRPSSCPFALPIV